MNHMVEEIIWFYYGGQSKRQLGTNYGQPVGYVTADVTEDMEDILYTEEL